MALHPTTSDFNYSMVFGFERDFDEESFMQWMLHNWTLCFWYSALYVIIIFGGKYLMEKRPKFDLRPALALWSAILGLFSIMGAARTLPEMVYVIEKYGFTYSVCNPSYFNSPTAFWAFMFTISKVYELGDTMFIVLRKQQLIFLHWYHHISTLIYVWYSYTDHLGPGRWFMVMNYVVHSFMYTYYAFRAMRFCVPKWVSVCITTMQITQMILGTTVNVWAYDVKSRGEYCQATLQNLRCSIMMYVSYWFLFSYFFYNAYLRRSQPASMEKIHKKSE
uniref:Elongation of very long chain fatty acids protein n=1 Tax=Hediste diversicolor TaxID=126592 RepID=A0AAF1C073_HEDDI|nr:elongation of very long chain fatty acids protein 3/6 [Hediste diversicolor]